MFARRSYGLDSLELKALSVPSSLRFLIGIEYDVVLCVTEVGLRRHFSLQFPPFAETFRKLLALCGTRFSLTCKHSEDGSVLSGTAVMPLLRYADYLPGALHVEELLECLQVMPSTQAKYKDPAAANGDGGDAAATTTGNLEFVASFLDYSDFVSDASLNDVHGLGFYLTLDYGLSMASHGHLVSIRFHSDWDPKEALREFQEFSGWDKFDLRFFDDQNKRQGGIIVMPSIQDVNDLLEKYEDEDSDDEGDLLPFILRPVSPMIPVPCVEDSALRKLREQYWDEILRFWERFPKTKHTVVVFNLYEGATLPEILSFLEGLPIVSSSFVEDDSPAHRRRVFVTLATADATKKALELDGKSTRGRTLRVQVSPPYITESRRGHILPPDAPPASSRRASAVAAAAAAAAAASTSTSWASSATTQHNAGNSSTTRSMPSPGPLGSSTGRYGLGGEPAGFTPPLPRREAAALVGAGIDGKARRDFAAPPPRYGEPVASHHHLPVGGPLGSGSSFTGHPGSAGGMGTPNPTAMNVEAKEFVPHFVLNANSPEFRPAAAHPSIPEAMDEALPPPPPPPPPPSYEAALAFPGSNKLSARMSGTLSHEDPAANVSLPPYSLPPPYTGGLPPSTAAAREFPPPPPPPPYTGN